MEGRGDVTRERTRIYVGGLGGGVTEDDLRKTFSALGEVASVDVVRTKGRSFAYLDFLPSSDKSLPKLFSTYNGCMWKGGKLRLEKAKEHYLVRLKREWEDESQLATKDSSKSQTPLQKSTKPSAEINKQLCLFFPKLGKVKSLSQVGMGKHKYSFQRIQVPPIPTHFCDCEQHSVPFLPTKKNQISEFDNNANNGINEQELNIMNSVMNKIFQRANPSTNQSTHQSKPVKDETDANENSEEDHMTDEDNLIINVGTGNDGVDLLSEMRSMMANQDAVASKHDGRKKKVKRANRVLINNQKSELVKDESGINIENREENHKTDEDNLIINVANGGDDVDLLAEMRIMVNQDSGAKLHKGREKKATPPVKKRKSPHSIEKQVTDTTMVPELSGNKSTWKDLIGRKRNNTPLTIPDIIPTVHQEKQNKSDDDDDDDDMETNKLGSPEKDAGEVDRAGRGGSWRQKSPWAQLIGQSSFSISQIVPELSGESHEAVNGLSPPTRVTTESTGRKEISLERKTSLILGNLESEGTCPFMRTETSMSEWKRAKTSLNNSPNKMKKSDDGSP